MGARRLPPKPFSTATSGRVGRLPGEKEAARPRRVSALSLRQVAQRHLPDEIVQELIRPGSSGPACMREVAVLSPTSAVHLLLRRMRTGRGVVDGPAAVKPGEEIVGHATVPEDQDDRRRLMAVSGCDPSRTGRGLCPLRIGEIYCDGRMPDGLGPEGRHSRGPGVSAFWGAGQYLYDLGGTRQYRGPTREAHGEPARSAFAGCRAGGPARPGDDRREVEHTREGAYGGLPYPARPAPRPGPGGTAVGIDQANVRAVAIGRPGRAAGHRRSSIAAALDTISLKQRARCRGTEARARHRPGGQAPPQTMRIILPPLAFSCGPAHQ